MMAVSFSSAGDTGAKCCHAPGAEEIGNVRFMRTFLSTGTEIDRYCRLLFERMVNGSMKLVGKKVFQDVISIREIC